MAEMMNDPTTDTIAAVGTARAPAAISILRLSGPAAFDILDRMFQYSADAPPAPRKLAAGTLSDPATGAALDAALAARFPAPASYTGEDVAEMFLHGGVFVTNRALECAISLGARAALPGEFTMRAFANGKMDLTQAEAVNDVINARNERFLLSALAALQGRLGADVRAVRAGLIYLLSSIEVVIEYPDEDVPEMPRTQVEAALRDAEAGIAKLLDGYAPAQLVNRGPSVAIAGRPNVGKSSIMNRLLGQERSIIHDAPGTTRDLVGETLSVAGVDALIMDTAGITDAADPVEREGVERTRRFIESADLVLLVFDASRPTDQLDVELIDSMIKSDRPFAALLNKTDLEAAADAEKLKNLSGGLIKVSAKTGTGFEAVSDLLKSNIKKGLDGMSEALVTNARHKLLLEQSRDAVRDALTNSALPLDILSIDIRTAANCLGQITGENTTDDILENIFSNFCVGK